MEEILLISLLTFLAGFVGTLSGFGLSTVMLPVLILFFPLPTTLLFVGIIHAFSDLWKVILFRNAFNPKIIVAFGIPGIIASLVGAKIVLIAPQDLMIRIFGLFLIAYVIFITLKPRYIFPHTTFTSFLGGVSSGFMAGVFGMGGAVRSVFLSAFNLPKHIYIFATGAIGLIIDSGRLFTYYFGGIHLEEKLLYGLILYIPITFVAAEVAKKVVDQIPQNKFRITISTFIFIIGVKLFVSP